ncbi:MAG: DUF3833 domain-containing protein [Mangrovicoccus sp.]
MHPIFFVLLGLLLGCAGIALAQRFLSFAAQRPQDYADQGPNFDIRTHLSGEILCEGVIYGPTGRVAARFIAEMVASWQGDTGVMTERFHYDSGAVQDREWQLTLGKDGKITARADDLLGDGRGQQSGAAVQLGYRIRLPESSGGWVMDVTDWMYLMENGTIINRSQFRKYGFKLAELVATMRKKEDQAQIRPAA